MTVRDLIGTRANALFTDDKVLQCDIIVMDGRDGKILCDSRRSTRETMRKYYDAEISALWADIRSLHHAGFGDTYTPVMKCHVYHNSWVKENKHDE